MYNNKDVTEKYKYIENLQENKLISNDELKHQDDDYKKLVFMVDDKKLITQRNYSDIRRFKYFVTPKGREILQYYNDDVIQKIVTDLT